jgi:hypothetical protein
VELLRLGQDLEPPHLRHAQIGDHHVELAGPQGGEALTAARGGLHPVSGATQKDRQKLAHGALVVDDQDVSDEGGHVWRARSRARHIMRQLADSR